MQTRRRLAIWTTSFLLMGPTVAIAQEGGLRYTISVESFTNESGWRGQINLGRELGTVLTALLHESHRFIVVGESAIRGKALEEQDLTASGRGARGSRSPVSGNLAEAQLLVRGAITHVQTDTAEDGVKRSFGRSKFGLSRAKSEINVTFYLIDTTTGTVVAAQNFIAEASRRRVSVGIRGRRGVTEIQSKRSDNLMKAVQKAASEALVWIAQQLEGVPWEGSIVMIDGDKIFVNRGSREGVRPKMRFSVGKAKVIRDPNTGEKRGSTFDELARVEVAQTQSKLSICDLVSGDLKRLRPGLDVRLAN